MTARGEGQGQPPGNRIEKLTDAQRDLQIAAQALSDALDALVPSNVAHFAVEDLRLSLRVLQHNLGTVKARRPTADEIR